MTPDLMEQGAKRLQALSEPHTSGKTESGGREAGFARIAHAGEVDTAHGRILYLENVNVSFDGFKAINNLSLDIAPGELRCIIGPNGAGKTTMMDIITGKPGRTAARCFLAPRSTCSASTNLKLRKWALAASFKNPPCLSSSACLKTWSSRSKPTRP